MSCRAEEAYPDLLPIGEIRGKVSENGDATKFRARLNKESVVVKGVVHQILRWRTQKGDDVYGFFIQNLPEDADGDPDTSDGLFVYMGRTPVLPIFPQGNYDANVGDLLTLRGEVNERYGQTEFSNAKVLEVSDGGDLDKSIVPVRLQLPESRSERNRMLEKLEGMRVRFPAGAVAVSGSHPQYRTWDSQLWVIPSDHPAAVREEAFARRIYRPAHPLSTIPDELKNDWNGNHLVLGSLGLEERMDDRDAALPKLHAGSAILDEVVGGIHYSWGEYLLQVASLPEVESYAEVIRPFPEIDAEHPNLRIAAYNVENLYDYKNDPFDDCDFHDDEGCPGSRFPLNYVPLSDEIFQARVQKIAEQIVEDLRSPDILMIQEAEDQDIAKMVDGRMIYGNENHADGQIDSLQEVAIAIVALGGPEYEILVDRDGADGRGIICAWMVQTEHLKAVEPESGHWLFGAHPALPPDRIWLPLCGEVSNPKAFNAVFTGTPDNASEMEAVYSRPVQVLLLEDTRNGNKIWLQNNHFSAGPDRRVERRKAQAAVNAELSQVIRSVDPEAVLVVGGDMNVFPRPDDPLDPPSDQLGPLYDAGLFNVVDRTMKEDPARSYSYIYQGVANVLDHFFLSAGAKSRLEFAAYLKLNAGSPEGFPDVPPLRASDHDPLLIELKW
ncbi:hypothetical protein P0Y35_02575 [Kiritimatiellaeota bacterium B1221]|nr:hypothetical protein [Kiritimatiellaeota bacterium B1221]